MMRMRGRTKTFGPSMRRNRANSGLTADQLVARMESRATGSLRAVVQAHRATLLAAAREVIAARNARQAASRPPQAAQAAEGCNPLCTPAGPLVDAAGQKYSTLYRVLPLSTVLASNDPGNMRPRADYPPEFQARDLSSIEERSKVRTIAQNLDPERVVWCNMDPTLGPPVVWEGDGTHGTQRGHYYVLGGNGRTLAIAKAPPERYAAYAALVTEHWPSLVQPAMTGPAPRPRFLLARVVRQPDGSPLPFDAAVQLAGASQQSTAAEESLLGRALSTVRGLGLDVTKLPSFDWDDVLHRDNAGAFIGKNPQFWSAVLANIDPAKREMYQFREDKAAELIIQIMVGFLPPAIQQEGLGNRSAEEALLGSTPILISLHAQILAKQIKPIWDLWPVLPDAVAFARKAARERMSVAALNNVMQEAGMQMGAEGLGKSLMGEISPLGAMLGYALYRAAAGSDPEARMGNVYLRPYIREARTDVPSAMGGFGFGGAHRALSPAAELARRINKDIEIPEVFKRRNPRRRNPQHNPARAARRFRDKRGWQRTPPTLTPGHADTPDARCAARLAERAFRGEGEPLGRGNYGHAVLLDGCVVKLPNEKDIHGRVWEREQLVDAFVHEAGVANELTAAGYRIVPGTVYAQLHNGWPALVREYGAPVDTMTPAAFSDLERALSAVEAAGWRVQDDLLVMRRPDGSVYIADVGVWEPKPRGALHDDTDLRWLTDQWADKHVRPSIHGVPSLASVLGSIDMLVALGLDFGEDYAAQERAEILDAIDKRRAHGMYAPDLPPDLL